MNLIFKLIMKLFNKTMLSAVITLSTASVYYAQQVQDTADTRSQDIEQVILTGVADIAKDRKTPVAVSTIKEAQIVEKLGNQEFPEILNTTPSVYATKGGGGFGDGRINIRGFDTNNIAVMINGVPVNDMENGSVYWSNWAGLSDVTSAMQVQRGLGASKLAIASVGGTINILTRAADKKREGNVTVGVGNDGWHKAQFSYNTGKSATGWSSSFLMSRTAGSMYIDGSEFEAYNYYFALGFQPNAKHDFQFTITGAPQWHHQNYSNTISDFLKYGSDGEPNRKYNSNWGYLNGQEFTTNRNYYSKPIASINWDWNISSNSKLSTVGYASWGRGGGTGILGSINGKSVFSLPKTADGQIRWDDIVTWNQGGTVSDFGANNTFPAGQGINRSNNGITRRASVNSHDWYGLLTNFQHKINENWNFSVGLDGRYYYGYHPGVITDLLGANGYLERGDANVPDGYVVTGTSPVSPSANPFDKAIKDKSQIAYRNYNGQVKWLGAFGQVEYSTEAVSAFLQGSVSNQSYQRIDNWVIDGVTVQQGQTVNTKTGYNDFWGYNVKAGANFNLNENNNVFVNAGYYEKQPQFTSVYPNNQQVLNPNVTNEKISSVEAGYGLRTGGLRANVNLYYTSWNDRFLRLSGIPLENGENGYANMLGVKEVHMGAEFEASWAINDFIELNGMFSYGDWRYQNNPTGNFFDNNNNPINGADGTNVITLALDDIKVSDAAQTTASFGVTLKPVKDFRFYANWRYADRLYSRISINNSFIITDGVIPEAASKGALRLPDYHLFDLGANYTIRLNGGDKFIIGANVYNLFNTIYISDGYSSIYAGDSKANNVSYMGIDTANSVYFGTGTTWSASLSYRF